MFFFLSQVGLHKVTKCQADKNQNLSELFLIQCFIDFECIYIPIHKYLHIVQRNIQRENVKKC